VTERVSSQAIYAYLHDLLGQITLIKLCYAADYRNDSNCYHNKDYGLYFIFLGLFSRQKAD
jgi:hypothetical protein